MDNNTIDKQFSKVIESLGYSKDDLKKYLKIFDLPRKIKTIASTYSLSQRKEQISVCLDELKSRNSLLYLLFLKNTIETMIQLNEEAQNEVWSDFMNQQGIDVILFGYNSNNFDFLNNLLEFTIFIHNKRKYTTKANEFLFRILHKFDQLDKTLIFKFVNLEINKKYLLLPDNLNTKQEDLILENYNSPHCYCNTFLKKLTDMLFQQEKIGAEIVFLLSGEFELSKLLTSSQLTNLQHKFIDKEIYINLVNKFNTENKLLSRESVKEIIIFKNEQAGNYSIRDTNCIQQSESPNDQMKSQNSNLSKDTKHEYSDLKNQLSNLTSNISDRVDCKPQKCLEKQSVDSGTVDPRVSFIDPNPEELKKLKNTVEDLNTELKKIKAENQELKNKIRDFEASTKEYNNVKTQENTVSSEVFNNQKQAVPKGVGLFGRIKSQPMGMGQSQTTNSMEINKSSNVILNVIQETDLSLTQEKSQSTEQSQSSSVKPTGVAPKGLGLFGKTKPSTVSSNSSSASVSDQQQNDKPKPKFGFGLRQKSFQPTLVSDKSYTGIKWKKANKMQNHIFSKVNYENAEKLFNLSEFEQFETKAKVNEERNHSSQKTQTTTSASVIDQKKSYALNIALGRVKLSNSELIESISKCKFDNENLIKQLIMYYPTHEEHAQICDSNLEMGRAELMFKEIKDLDSFLNSLLSLRFKYYFENKDYLGIINSTTKSLKRISESTELVNLFANLLVIGNVLNSNSFNGNAEGFTLDSLSMFMNQDILEIVRKKTNIEKLLMEILGESSPSKIQLIAGIVSIETLIAEFNEAKSLFGSFVDKTTSEKYKRALNDFDELNQMYKMLQSYFGESDDSFISKLESFLKILKN